MNPSYANNYRIKPVNLPDNNLYKGCVTLNPKKSLSAWESLANDKVMLRLSLGPIFAHNVLAGILNARKSQASK